MGFFNESGVNRTCDATLSSFVQNLTSSYTDQRNEASMVAISALMFILAAVFFNLNLFSRLSDVSAILNPSMRLFLSTSLSLFLPVMSYLFSEAKNEGRASYGGDCRTSSGDSSAGLTLRARTILMWMLLVELLRKQADAVLVTGGGKQGYSGTIERASRIAWLGLLVFYNVDGAGRKAVYGIIWVLAATKLVQKVAISEIAKRSSAYGKNPRLLSHYMAQIQEEGHSDSGVIGSELLKTCKYAVMGEDKLEKKDDPRSRRYRLQLKEFTTVVTVGKIWMLEERGRLLDADSKRLCLSFALYKLLRRRFEDLPITDAETRDCRRLMFKGLCSETDTEGGQDPREATAVALFQVVDQELHFLSEYYHSFIPVVLASSFFFVANYILFPVTVWFFCVMTIVLCSNGDVVYAIFSLKTDNSAISVGLMKLMGCLLKEITKPPVLFTLVNLSVTILLLLTVLYEQLWELLIFILSKWLMVSLLSDYAAKPRLRDSAIFTGVIRSIMWLHGRMSHSNLCFKQFDALGLCWLSFLPLHNKAVPKEVKKSIMEYLLKHVDDPHGGPLSNGLSALAKHQLYQSQLSWACESESIAEVILTWHIGTSLLEMECQQLAGKKAKKKGTNLGSNGNGKVATTLSKYCAYLVAFHPELLPDEDEETERVYKAMKKELKVMGASEGMYKAIKRDLMDALRCGCYYLSPARTWYSKEISKLLLNTAGDLPGHLSKGDSHMTVVQKGAVLGKILIKIAKEGSQEDELPVWNLLADVWTELMVYVVPSSGELHVKAHKEALAMGGEFLTVLWALATHTGIARPAMAASLVEDADELQGISRHPACV
uniref:Predicted protein n=1 Tax=Hordeum vulgare subsp. vulgare TaxID=112509 RepID=F2DWA0_HORVV|nr:predicted protein [Hordeum vulgare subsp. vulgare]